VLSTVAARTMYAQVVRKIRKKTISYRTPNLKNLLFLLSALFGAIDLTKNLPRGAAASSRS